VPDKVPQNANREDLARTRVLVTVLFSLAFVLSVYSLFSPSLQLVASAASGEKLHLLLEFITTTIAVVVVAVSFQSLESGSGQAASALIYAFTVVACAGIAHTIVFEGSPDADTGSGVAGIVYFWLVRRLFETTALGLVAAAVALHRSRRFWFGAALGTTAAVVCFAVSANPLLRVLLGPEGGPSQLAHAIDAVLAAANLGAAFFLWRRGRWRSSRSDSLIAGSCAILGLVSLMLVLAPSGTQLPIIVAHGWRVVAYCCLYAGVYLFAIHEPHEKLRESEIRLRDSREQLKTIGDNLPKGMVYQIHADPSGMRRFLYVSAGIRWLNGLTPEAVVRDASTLYSLIHEHDRQALTLAEIRSYETMGPFNRVVRYYKGGRDDIGWLQICSAPRLSSDGIVVWDGVAIDVTDRERALADLKCLNAELEQRVAERTHGLFQANQSLESFSHVVAHDLRAPLRHVQSFAGLLKADHAASLDEQGRRLLDKVIEGGATLNRLIDGILAVSRLDVARLSRTETDLSALCEEIAADLAATEPRRHVQFRIQPGVKAMADRTLVRNVLLNLLGNAWKFTARQPHACIEFGDLQREGERVFFVRDNGAGFDPQASSRMFTLFTRLHPAEEFPGTGLGLASVRAVVVNHGGRVWAEGAPGKGATLYFTLSSTVPQRRHQKDTEATGPGPMPAGATVPERVSGGSIAQPA